MDILIEQLANEIKYGNKQGSSAGIHIKYDEIMREIAKRNEPELLKKLDKLVENITFWYD